jgi:hypothetical protein
MNNTLSYYVYCIYDEKHIPRYIGKGKGYRVNMHFKKYLVTNKKLKEYLNENFYFKKLIENITEEEAYKKEIEYIKLYGRLDKNEGTLYNLTDGGEDCGRTGFCYDEGTVKIYKNRKVFDLENILTGEIRHFESLGLAAKYIGTTKQNILALLQGENLYVKQVWKIYSHTPIHKNSKNISIKNIKSGEIINFNSQIECAKHIKVDKTMVSLLMKKKIKHIKNTWCIN